MVIFPIMIVLLNGHLNILYCVLISTTAYFMVCGISDRVYQPRPRLRMGTFEDADQNGALSALVFLLLCVYPRPLFDGIIGIP